MMWDYFKMRRCLLATLIGLILSVNTNAADLIDVFQQALSCDPTYQQAIAQASSIETDESIVLAALLPNLNFTAQPGIDREWTSGAINRLVLLPPNNLIRNNIMKLKLTQPIFNWERFVKLEKAQATSKQAAAKLTADFQDLIVRVAKAYFSVLEDEDSVSYYESSKRALQKQLSETKQKFHVGEKTRTDIYTAESAFGTAESNLTRAKTKLAINREFLRIMTAESYGHLTKLKNNIPLVSPSPNNIEAWVEKAECQNWMVRSKRYAVLAARHSVRQGYTRHFPTIEGQAYYTVQDNFSANSGTIIAGGSSKIQDKGVLFNINMPIFEGGRITAITLKAQYNYRLAQQSLEYYVRETAYVTRKSFLNIMTNIENYRHDGLNVKSTTQSLRGLEDRYNIGAETLVDVLTQQEKVVEAKIRYAKNRYAYIINLLQLKKAAGTLCVHDLIVINSWLNHDD